MTIDIPSDVTTVRGIIVALGYTADGHLRHWARTMSFAHMTFTGGIRPEGIVGVNGEAQYGLDLLNAIRDIAHESGHPEMQNAPIAWLGFSDGGSSGMAMASLIPKRMIAVANNDGAINVFDQYGVSVPSAMLDVPFFWCSREDTDGWLSFMQTHRRRGARWAQAFIHNRVTHEAGGHCWPMVLFFLQEAIHARYPRGATPRQDENLRESAVSLRTNAESSGFLVAVEKGNVSPEVAFFSEFSGSRAEAAWLINEASALSFRSTAAWNRDGPLAPLGVEIRRPRSVQTMRLSSPTGFADWERLDVLSGSEVLASFRVDESLDFSVDPRRLSVGGHFLHQRVVRGDQQRTSAPVFWIVDGVGEPGTHLPVVGPDAGSTGSIDAGLKDAGGDTDTDGELRDAGSIDSETADTSLIGPSKTLTGGCSLYRTTSSSYFLFAVFLGFFVRGKKSIKSKNPRRGH